MGIRHIKKSEDKSHSDIETVLNLLEVGGSWVTVYLNGYFVDTWKRMEYEHFFLGKFHLGLIKNIESDRYAFNDTEPSHIHPDILLYALLDYKGEDNTISLDGMQEVALIFGLSLTNLIELVREVVAQHPEDLSYTDNSGVKNLQFIHDIDAAVVLNHYYSISMHKM